MPNPTAARRRRRVAFGRRGGAAFFTAAALLGTAFVATPSLATAAVPDDHEPGYTLQTFQVPPGLEKLCTLKSGQTPNVDRLASALDLTSDDDFGLVDDFITHASATLTVPEDGEYVFRLTSDDGSRLTLDDELVVDNDGSHDVTAVENSATLTAGAHDLFVEHFDGVNGQRLLLEWKTPGSDSFEVVDESVLSTEAGVVRVTAPGLKYCEGATDTAGDGLRLDSVNPNYELVDLRPEGFNPKVSALAFDANDELLVSTTGSVSSGGWLEDPDPGEIFRVDGAAEATGPEDVTVEKVATDLLNPMGIDVIGDTVYVSERYQLTALTDPDGDGFYDTHTTVAEWPDGGNFHEFAFGLIHDEENFYLNLSVAIDNGGASTNPQPGENRGTSIAVDRETGEVSYVAGGLRTPNGISFGPNGDIFAMDNQGGWLPASKLVHVEQGRFFNHYTNPAGMYDDQPVTPPAVWLPQNEIGNSPSTPFYLEEGQFAGQLLHGDVTYGGLQRIFLEEVEGEYQGAVFRHSAGFEAGVNRVIMGPDGSFYVGGTGEGGNWGESGKLRHGLQKLVPTGENTFDMVAVRIAEGGLEVEYTEPISEETAAGIAEAYTVRQWHYTPTSGYGGPKIGEEALTVSDARVSEDGTTVSLDVDGITPGNVVYLRSPRPFESASGTPLLSTEAWYTANSVPGVEAPTSSGWYEAEEASLLGDAQTADEHVGHSGLGFVDGITSVGSGVSFPVTAEEAGTQKLNVRYANGPNPEPDMDKSMNLVVNGEVQDEPWVFSPFDDWKTWAFSSRDVTLKEGVNTIALRYDEGNDGNVNVDALSVGDVVDRCTPTDPADGYTSLFDGTLASFEQWKLAGPGSFGRMEDCSLRTIGGMGLLWYAEQEFEEYSLQLDWKQIGDYNSGIFVGSPEPGDDPWVAVDHGYEIQIDESDEPDRTTGSIYTFQSADRDAVDEVLNPVGQWNHYEIVVQGQNIKVLLNGKLVNDFDNTDPERDLSSGIIGIQNHGGGETVYFRDIQIKELADEAPAPEATVEAVPRCMAGKAVLAVRATNDGDQPVDLTISTEFGEREFAGVEPGKSGYHAFTIRSTDLGEGDVTVTVDDGESTSEITQEYAALSCG
ncbi:MAG: family 16 glycoside hydrolase [Microbacterium gubbeenense]|uniref:family 16 glycoside hydrolase n=4 Tax=Microbacterium gubbeenense TaxID=159896 RepID=UPI003F9B12CA